MAEPCLFCQIARGEQSAHVVWADDDHIAFLDRSPIGTGHTLLIPREHSATVYDISAPGFARLFERARALAAPVAKAAGAPRAGIAVEGFGVEHAHIHLVPVWRGGDLDPCRARQATEGELTAAAARLRALVDDRELVL